MYLLSMTRAHISDPMPLWGHPCSTVTRLCVFMTDSKIVCSSSGLIVLKFITWKHENCKIYKHAEAIIPCQIHQLRQQKLQEKDWFFRKLLVAKIEFYKTQMCFLKMISFEKNSIVLFIEWNIHINFLKQNTVFNIKFLFFFFNYYA